MKTLLKGEVGFVENNNNWNIDYSIKQNKKRIEIEIKSRKMDLKNGFPLCAIYDSNFLSFIFRTDSQHFSGKKSEFSELILESSSAQSLMNSRNSRIELNGKSLIYKGKIRKNDMSSLSNILTLNEMLIQEIEYLINEKVTQDKPINFLS